MKKILLFVLISTIAYAIAYADKPVTAEQLPAGVHTFISSYFPGEKINYAAKDDDYFRPDYNVSLANGVKLTFTHSGRMEKIETVDGVPVELVPVQITDYIKLHYPDSFVTEYEIDRRGYEVKLSNRLDLKFTKSWNLIEIDD